MTKGIQIKFVLGVILSFVFLILDFTLTMGDTVFHLGPFIVGLLLISVVTDLKKKDDS